MQWWLSIRERSLGKRTIPKDMKETAVKEDIKTLDDTKNEIDSVEEKEVIITSF